MNIFDLLVLSVEADELPQNQKRRETTGFLGGDQKSQYDLTVSLMEKVVLAESGCWLWLGSTRYPGYGIATVENRQALQRGGVSAASELFS